MIFVLQSLLVFMLSFAGLYLLWLAWKKRGNAKLSWLGWGLLVCALIWWAMIAGNDRGVAISLIVIPLQALGIIGVRVWQGRGQVSKNKARKKPLQTNTPNTAWPTYLARTWVAALVGPIAGLVAFVFSLGVHEILLTTHAHPANAFTTAVYTFPIVWAGLSVFLLISKRTIFKTAFLVLMTTFGALTLVLGN